MLVPTLPTNKCFFFLFAEKKKSYATIGSLLSDETCSKQWNQYYYSGVDLKYKKWLISGMKPDYLQKSKGKDVNK